MFFKKRIVVSAGTYDRLVLITQGNEELMLCVGAVALTQLHWRFSEHENPCVGVYAKGSQCRAVTVQAGLTVKAALFAFKELIHHQRDDVPASVLTTLVIKSGANHLSQAPESICATLESSGKEIVIECAEAAGKETLLEAISDVFDFFLSKMLSELDSPLYSLPVIDAQKTIAGKKGGLENVPDFKAELYGLCATYAPRLALYNASRQLTYEQLWHSVMHLADALKHHGVRPGSVVAIYCQCDIDPVLLMLATLCTGACYVPLDPAYPLDVLRDYLTESGVSYIVADDVTYPTAQQLSHTQTLLKIRELLDSKIIGVGDFLPVTKDRMAYVIFTSGSTGKRKAVGVSVSALLKSTHGRVQYYGAAQDNVRNMLIASISFDSSIGVIYGSLFAGEALFLPVAGSEKDVNLTLEAIEAQAVTSLLTLPSYVKLLVEADSIARRSKGLQRVICAGEALEKSLVNALCHQRDGLAVFNEYGPTEGTVWSTVNRVNAEESEVNVSIGYAHANNSVYILDEHLNELPPGIEGELYIGGETLAIGYLNDARETATRFIPNPFSDNGSRLYRTGDRVSRTASGALDYLGRSDRQLKISGYRVSLAELEDKAVCIAGVHEAAAVVADKSAGNIQLFICADHPVAEFTHSLKLIMPAHAIPSTVMLMDVLPRLPNRKIDYQTLTQMAVAQAARASADGDESRQESLETYLSTLWQSILKVEITEPSQDFFELGGSSIKAIMVLNRIQKKIGRTLYIGSTFEQPTISGMANYLRANFSDALLEANMQV
ncbi:non-ribosomal peptide synthetase [Pseudomonas sp. L1(2025)]|uniref:non-ribosomal peptide synthetase n=1 Tax=Pseudomonas sp. L1(2025) TaxID=3449429 RepID=UPI003F68DDC2